MTKMLKKALLSNLLLIGIITINGCESGNDEVAVNTCKLTQIASVKTYANGR